MRVSVEKDSALLEHLALMLVSAQMPVQQAIAEETGVAQSLVSRARNGKLRRVTAKVRRLAAYASGRIDAEELATITAKAIDTEGPPGSLGSEDASGMSIKTPRKRYQKEAMDGIKAYLDDGYDPRLIIEQLAVLRRAQKVRRPGPQSQGDRT